MFSHTSPSRGRAGKTAVWSPCGTRPEYGTRGISHPRNGQVPAGAPQQYDPLLAVRADGGVVYCSLRMARPLPTPCRVCSGFCVSNKFSHFRQKRLKTELFSRCVSWLGETRLEAYYILDSGLGLEPTVLSFCLWSPPRTRASERAGPARVDGWTQRYRRSNDLDSISSYLRTMR